MQVYNNPATKRLALRTQRIGKNLEYNMVYRPRYENHRSKLMTDELPSYKWLDLPRWRKVKISSAELDGDLRFGLER